MTDKTPDTRIEILELRTGALEAKQKDFVLRTEWEPYLWVLRALIVAGLTVLLTAVLTNALKGGIR